MVAEALISPVASEILKALIKIISDQRQDLKAALGVEKEIENLLLRLNKIKAVLDDAERRSFKEESFKLWVEEMEGFCYDVEDVVDEWSTRSRRLQMERSSQVAAAGTCSSLLPSCLKRICMLRDISEKIKQLDSRLDRITKDNKKFKFDRASLECTHTMRPDSVSYVVPSEIQGRESDASALISKLVDNNNNNSPPVVISIVGAGGIGKTALAQLVFGDQQIKNHFTKLVWVCVSQHSDEIKLAKAIVESTTGHSTDLSQLQMLLEQIQSILSQKRFLLVLDDVWTEDYTKWESFNNCLKELGKNCPGTAGSRILVTTRKKNVAKIMGSVYVHQVELISDTDACSLLSRIAFSGRSSREAASFKKLEHICHEIAKRCKGLPLAVKVMGQLLYQKDTEDEWEKVLTELDTKLSNVKEVKTCIFFPHLYLSYHDLTPPMKRCFLYCAVFPKDYTIYVDNLIRIWMAQGYLTTNDSDHSQMEQNGRDIFKNLAMCSLFQDLEKDDMDPNIIISCKMHDIVHEFVKFLTKNDCYNVVSQEDKVKIGNLRHLSWQKTRRSIDLASICDVPEKLRSFFAGDLSAEQHTTNMFNGLKYVRVLGLHGYMLQKLPREIGNLIHLRYIDLRESKVEELPKSICSLDNLQTLDLRGCSCLSRLPEEIGKLQHLRNIDLSESKVKELPKSICNLDNLQTLELRGCTCLLKLPEEIEKLRHLRKIDLSESKVEELPNSICSLNNLQTLDLRGCSCLFKLPEDIGSLHQLRWIDLRGCKVELPNSICSVNNLEIRGRELSIYINNATDD